MRVAILLALMLATVALIARANDAPTSAPSTDPTLSQTIGDAFDSAAPLVPPTAPPAVERSHSSGVSDSPANETSILAKSTEGKVCVVLKEKSFEIHSSDKPEPAANESLAASLVCDHVTTTSAPGGAASLKSTNGTLTLPNGITATASEIAFDFKSNTLTLVGTEEQPVSVKMAGTVSTCPKLEMKINRKNWGVPATVVRGQVLSTIGPGGAQLQSRY